MSRFCCSCGVKLSRKNAYKNRKRGKGYRRFCKNCHNKQSYDKKLLRRTKLGTYKVKAINRANALIFSSYNEKRSFLTLRRLQSIGIHPSIGHSSRLGQRVEHIVEERDKETRELRRYYQETLCSECDGIIRFDDRGFKVCVDCGLLAELFTLSNELGTDAGPRDLRPHEYYSYARQDISSEEESA